MSPTSRGKKSVAFAKPSAHHPSSRHGPALPLSQLDTLASQLVLASKEASTRRGYTTANKTWRLFTTTYHLPLLPSIYSLRLYAAFLAHRGIRSPAQFFSALAWEFAAQVQGWDRIRSHPLVKDAILGARKLNAQPVKRSPPLLPTELLTFFTATLSAPHSHDDLLALTIAVVGFGALMRLGELVEPQHSDDRDERKYIKRSSARVVGSSEFHFHLPYHKADRSWRGSDVAILEENSVAGFNFIKLISLYLTSRDRLPVKSKLLFIRSNGSLAPRQWFIDRLRRFAPTSSGHSLRAGGATYLASIGTSPDFIQRMGRWSSEAVGIYLRDQPALSAVLSRDHLGQRRRF